jgi:lysophospholipase L1-like esterase
MRAFGGRARWRLGAILLAAAAAAVASLLAAGSSGAGGFPGAGGSPGRLYLALGDSVPFGYITQAGYEYGNPDNFVGYPSYAGDALGMETVNAACPGEATGGFISATSTDDNGCRPYKAAFPLHVSYGSTQLDFATSFLRSHPNTRLVTIGLGANDAFLLEGSCNNDPTCIGQGLPGLLATIGTNMDTILRDLRRARYHGVLMIVNYYSLDYSDPAGTALTQELNAAITSHARQDGAIVADVFSAFQQAASTSFAGGQTCKAGLLNTYPGNQAVCDVHLSQSGAKLVAQTIEDTYYGGKRH